MSYRNSVSLGKKINDFENLMSKYPNYIPVIIECDGELNNTLKKKKYMITYDDNAGHLLQIIRCKITLNQQQGLFMFYNNVLICPSDNIGELYKKYKIQNKITRDNDNFFYITLKYENVFG